MRAKIVLYYNDLVYRPSISFLFKDFGQVPYVLSQLYDCDLEYWISTNNRASELDQFRGKRVRQFSKIFGKLPARLDFFKNIAVLRAIRREVAATHLLVFPFTPLSDLLVALRAKRRWPELKLIVKLDTNREFLERIKADWLRNGRGMLRYTRQCWHYRLLLRLADVIICETSECERILRAGFLGLDLDAKLVKAYSGLSRSWLLTTGVRYVPAGERRNVIVVSGRISSWQKHTSLILEAGPPPGWTIEFVGQVDPELEEVIQGYKTADPNFDHKFRFHGVISDKRAYFEVLMHARALLMNSRGNEGFPNVFAEAHFCGLVIVSSDVSGAADATGEGRWGLIYPRDSLEGLRAALAELPKRVELHRNDPALDAHRQRFIWEQSLSQPLLRRAFAVSAD